MRTMRSARAARRSSWVTSTSAALGVCGELEDQVGDVGGVGCIEVAGGLVGEQQRRAGWPAPAPAPRAAARRRRAGADSGLAGRRARRGPATRAPSRSPSARRRSPAARRRFPRRSCWGAGGRPGRPARRARVSSARGRPRPSRESSLPSSRTLPRLGRSRPAATAIRVDLPEPDGPTTATRSPASTRSRRRAGFPPGQRPMAGSARRRRAPTGRLAWRRRTWRLVEAPRRMARCWPT